jgi:hypothetical protein
VGELPRNNYQVEDLQKKMKKTRGKIAQFLAESLNEQVLEQQQANYELFRDGSIYIAKCQNTGQVNTHVLLRD